jgi:hypothetical protein
MIMADEATDKKRPAPVVQRPVMPAGAAGPLAWEREQPELRRLLTGEGACREAAPSPFPIVITDAAGSAAGRIQRQDGEEGNGPEEEAEVAPGSTSPEGISFFPFQFQEPNLFGEPEPFRFLRLTHPELFEPLALGDLSPFRISLMPLNPFSQALLQPQQPSFLNFQPPAPVSSGAAAPTVPGSATLYSLGPARFRVVFEENGPQLPPELAEEETRFRALMGEDVSPGTGTMVKAIVKNLLTQTEPGRQILSSIGSVIGSSEEEGSGFSWNLNIDVLPAPVLEGELPAVQLMLEAHWP